MKIKYIIELKIIPNIIISIIYLGIVDKKSIFASMRENLEAASEKVLE